MPYFLTIGRISNPDRMEKRQFRLRTPISYYTWPPY